MPHLQRWHDALQNLLMSLSFPRQTGDVAGEPLRKQDFGVLNLISQVHDPRDSALTRVLIRDVEQAIADVSELISEQQRQVCLRELSAHEGH